MASRYHTLTPITLEKSYFVKDVKEAHLVTLLGNIRRLTSVRHKNTFLRVLNGDLITNDRLNKIRIRETGKCDSCENTEDREHILIECKRSRDIWTEFYKIVQEATGRKIDLSLENILCISNAASSLPLITVTIEVCSRIISRDRPILKRKSLVTILQDIIKRESQRRRGRNEWQKWQNFLQN